MTYRAPYSLLSEKWKTLIKENNTMTEIVLQMLPLFLLTFSNLIFSRKPNKCIVSKFCYKEIVIIVITAGVGIINFLTIP